MSEEVPRGYKYAVYLNSVKDRAGERFAALAKARIAEDDPRGCLFEEDRIVKLLLTVNPDGTIAGSRITSSSSVPLLDLVGTRTLETMAPLDPPPAGLLTDGRAELPISFKIVGSGAPCRKS
jgi:TonB family protein